MTQKRLEMNGLRINENQPYTITTEIFAGPGIADHLIDNKTLVGLCNKRKRGNCLWITNFEIFKPYRDNDLGTRFIQLYEDMGRQRKCNMIECEPIESSIEFWSKVGFSDVGPRERTNVFPREEGEMTDPIYRKII